MLNKTRQIELWLPILLMRVTTASNKRGFTLLACGIAALALFGAAGLAIDMGRLFITKNEAQSYADAGAIAAALQLDGSTAGLARADAAVDASINTWNFGTTKFNSTVKEYSSDGSTNWHTSASANAATSAFARVTAVVS